MERINNNPEFNNSNNQPNQHTLYTIAETDYKRFLKHMENSDMKNGYTRYLAEFSFLSRMLKHAQTEGRTKEISEIKEKINQVDENLKKFGISIK